jgi:Tol biopolymer transport system component
MCNNGRMIPGELSLLVQVALCAFIPVAVANGQSVTAVKWEIKKVAFEVPTGIYNPRADGGLATVTFGTVIVSDILVIDTQDSKPKKLVTGTFPAWSPDGAQLAYCTRDGLGFGQIQVINADGTGKKQLTNIKGGACYPDWSPDGAKIVFTAFGGKNPDVFVMDKDGQNLMHIASGYAARWSPDGSKLVFLRGPEKGNSQRSIWVATADGRETKPALQGDGSLQDARWLPDGTGIVFSSSGTGNQSIFLSHLNGAQPSEIEKDDRYDWFDPSISPDGKHLIADVKCIRDFGCTDLSRFDPRGAAILVVSEDTHQHRLLAYGMHPSIVWSKN